MGKHQPLVGVLGSDSAICDNGALYYSEYVILHVTNVTLHCCRPYRGEGYSHTLLGAFLQ